jgi:hypothetical protein
MVTFSGMADTVDSYRCFSWQFPENSDNRFMMWRGCIKFACEEKIIYVLQIDATEKGVVLKMLI